MLINVRFASRCVICCALLRASTAFPSPQTSRANACRAVEESSWSPFLSQAQVSAPIRSKLGPGRPTRHHAQRWQPLVWQAASTGGWVVINQIGAILYLNIDVLVANRLFGPEQSGKYAAIMQLPYLIRLLGTTVVAVFSPTVLYYFARNDLEGVMVFLRRAIKCLGLVLALPIALMCGFSEPLLRLYLGREFSGLSPLLFLMAAHLCFFEMHWGLCCRHEASIEAT